MAPRLTGLSPGEVAVGVEHGRHPLGQLGCRGRAGGRAGRRVGQEVRVAQRRLVPVSRFLFPDDVAHRGGQDVDVTGVGVDDLVHLPHPGTTEGDPVDGLRGRSGAELRGLQVVDDRPDVSALGQHRGQFPEHVRQRRAGTLIVLESTDRARGSRPQRG
ncbi:hypothetical protein J2S42_001061 [Catenuloplanes indicus]|uniref:Uncharacterized protein n=1 Tax=Catenuloplanes indicus TaxID=137267 RepID=A0AAE3VVI8_9ACTN|nr:hypothetical protein [Catenuloplanes indicus]